MQIAALPIDKQQQFARGQRELVPKYLAKNAASGLNTTSTLTVVSFRQSSSTNNGVSARHSPFDRSETEMFISYFSFRIPVQRSSWVLHLAPRRVWIMQRMAMHALYVSPVLICKSLRRGLSLPSLFLAFRIGQQLRKDQAHVLKPDFKSRFLTRGDAIKRLTRYHVFTKPASPAYEPTDDECQQCQ